MKESESSFFLTSVFCILYSFSAGLSRLQLHASKVYLADTGDLATAFARVRSMVAVVGKSTQASVMLWP